MIGRSVRLARLLAAHAWLRLRRPEGSERQFLLARSRLHLAHERDPASRNARFLGLDIDYLDFVDLRRVIDEVFGRGVYAFAAASPTPLILDCGANIGISVLFFKRLVPAARIVAFEPDPRSFALLERNVRANRLESVTLHRAAVLDRAGEVDFYAAPDGRGSLVASTQPERAPGADRTRVPALRLSEQIDGPVDLLKLDVEGAEDQVLADLAASGKLASVREMHVEYHHHLRPDQDRLAGFLARLEAGGFGYQLAASAAPSDRGVFQDVLIHAYRRRPPPPEPLV